MKPKGKSQTTFDSLRRQIIRCERCPRLRRYCETVAREKRRAYMNEDYWGKPVPGFGDPKARLVLVGLAPAAHGANRTGRIFTGDRSGDWLYSALFQTGFANQAVSISADDGLKLKDAWVTCTVRCAPPENKPLPKEFKNCLPYLEEELGILTQGKVYVALGAIALQTLEKYFRSQDVVTETKKWKFKHGARFHLQDDRIVLASYHPSQQNTFTGKLTEAMFDSIFQISRAILGA